jgi:hypothetical protein
MKPNKLDILFASIPYVETSDPAMAPGVLKSVAISAGYSSQAIDLNAELLILIKQNPDFHKITKFLVHNNLHSESIDNIVELINMAADRILSFNAKIVGLSLLTMHSQVFTYWLCVRLKSISPDTQILIGGPGIKSTVVSTNNDFCNDLLDRGLIDHYITGDGERSLVEFLNGNYSYPGIDSPQWQEIRDIENFPFPDYSDYNFDIYEFARIPISDSRGCVRTCEFCDVIEHWKKFVYRSAESVFNEMLTQIERYKIYNFSFRSSLMNGNLKEFRKLMKYIADYNEGRDRSVQISWDGYFIIRSESQHPEEMWEVMSKTNPDLLLGVESVVHHVRWGLGKKFNDEDIDYHLVMAKKYKVQLTLLLIVGYPTETRNDYEFTKQWFRDRVELYGYNNPVKSINLAQPAILENTQLDRNSEKLKLKRGQNNTIWINTETNITPQERVSYYNELYDICKPFNPPTGIKLEAYKTLEELSTQESL